MSAVRSASRAQPIAEPPTAKKKLSKAKLQEGAIDTLMNSVSILAEMMEDFKSSDRFFKYKAGVLGLWLFLSISTFAVACPGQGPSNEIDAQLVVTQGANGTLYMVKNASESPWSMVKVIVNNAYQSTLNQVDANGTLLLSPAVLYDTNGARAPSHLVISDIVVDVDSPSAQIQLLKDGKPQ